MQSDPYLAAKERLHLLSCACGVKALDDQYFGEFTEVGYVCANCVRKLNKEAVRKSVEK